jgi:hypothetical protein
MADPWKRGLYDPDDAVTPPAEPKPPPSIHNRATSCPACGLWTLVRHCVVMFRPGEYLNCDLWKCISCGCLASDDRVWYRRFDGSSPLIEPFDRSW